MEIFEGLPRDKFFDILFHANRNLVENELENLLIRLIALENLCEKNGISENEIFTFIAENEGLIDSELNDKFIGLTGNILSNNE